MTMKVSHGVSPENARSNRGRLVATAARLQTGPPDVARGLRAGVAVGIPMVLFVLLGHVGAGSVVALGALQTCLVDGGYSFPQRLRISLITALVCALAMFVGTLGGQSTATAIIFVAGWLGVASFSGVFGPSYDTLGVATSIIAIFAILRPGGVPFALEQSVLILAGGLWCIASSLAWWWEARDQPFKVSELEAITAAKKVTFALAELLAEPSSIDRRRRDLRDSITSLRLATSSLRSLVRNSYRKDPQDHYLFHLATNLERIGTRASAVAETVALFDSRRRPLPPAITLLTSHLSGALSIELTGYATARRSTQTDRIEIQIDGDPQGQIQSREYLAQLISLVDELRSSYLPDPERLTFAADLGVLLRSADRLSDSVSRVTRASEQDLDHNHPMPESKGVLSQVRGILRPHLSWDSPRARFAIRLSLSTAVAESIVIPLHIAHGVWLVLTLLVVLRTERSATFTRALQRIVGTISGSLLAAALIAILTNQLVLAASFGVLTALSFALLSVNYGYFVVLVTPTVLLLGDIATPGGWQTAGIRVLLTVFGGALALVADAFLWPVNERDRLPLQLAELLKSIGHYLEEVLKSHTGSQVDVSKLVAARTRAEAAYAVARDTTDRLSWGTRSQWRESKRYLVVLEANYELLRAVRAAAVNAIGHVETLRDPSDSEAFYLAVESGRQRALIRIDDALLALGTQQNNASHLRLRAEHLSEHLELAIDGLYRARASEIAQGVSIDEVTPLRLAIAHWHDLLRHLERIDTRLSRVISVIGESSVLSGPPSNTAE